MKNFWEPLLLVSELFQYLILKDSKSPPESESGADKLQYMLQDENTQARINS